MDLRFDIELARSYKSPSRKAGILSEFWVEQNIFCPNCGNDNINKFETNRPVADFYCSECKEEYELKSGKTIGNKIMDGAYEKKIERLKDNHNPNLFVLNYDLEDYNVINLFVVPKYYFVPDIIEKRKPLSSTARRHGWVGSNILLDKIPQSGKILFIKDKIVRDKSDVLSSWKKTIFLRKEKEVASRGWILDIMNCIDKLNKREFNLRDMYSFETVLSEKHPDNKHVKDKIRQQLQYLRDRNYLMFLGAGNYRVK